MKRVESQKKTEKTILSDQWIVVGLQAQKPVTATNSCFRGQTKQKLISAFDQLIETMLIEQQCLVLQSPSTNERDTYQQYRQIL